MGNVLVIAVIVLICLLGWKETKKHFKGQGSCCGGGGGLIREEKRLEGVKWGEFTLKVEGMSCENCEIRIENAIHRTVEGTSARASQKKSQVTVCYDREVELEKVKQSIRDAGYEVKE